jgi:L-alanine-DL-glutamate epimerase-like enolase superfamily enzyme
MSARHVSDLRVVAYTIPTDTPEADGTLEWDATTIVVVEAAAGGATGIGYTYGSAVCAAIVHDLLAPLVRGCDALDVRGAWGTMVLAVRNAGRPGVCTHAISAVDSALWDLKARLLGIPLTGLLGRVRDRIPGYGSGGFTNYSDARLAGQLEDFVEAGCTMVKMKIGADPRRDPHRVRVARSAVGTDVELFVDANGAFTVPSARGLAQELAGEDVTWFEEPVSSDDLSGLAQVRAAAPAGMAVAAGEYGYVPAYFRQMLAAGAVDVLQADATRCGGITGFMDVAALAEAHCVPLSAHTAPALHAHVGCAAGAVIHVEVFHDHARIEHMLFDGAPQLEGGQLAPDTSAAGNGLVLRRDAAEAAAA